MGMSGILRVVGFHFLLLLLVVYTGSIRLYCQDQKHAIIIGHVNSSDSGNAGLLVTIDSALKTITDHSGNFEFKSIPYGEVKLEVTSNGLHRYMQKLKVSHVREEVHIDLPDVKSLELESITVTERVNSMGKIEAVRGTSIFEAKKHELLVLKNLDANLATNNTRQVFAKVAGTNVWENDGSGIQVNVSSRGLSPNRSWEYNMRQNEYDIAADIMGYPDMYYSPPMEAVANIEVVRGSAALQYGTQMGGLLNFVLKEGNPDRPLEIEMKQSVGSYGLYNSYNSIGGTKNKWTYFGYFHHRNADGWRKNSDYNWNTGFASVSYKFNDKFKMGIEYTRMEFLLHLSAGLTDSVYQVNPQTSFRARNWFNVEWNIPSMKLEYKISDRTRMSLISYMLLSSRKSIENTKPVNDTTDKGFRDIRKDNYHNFGSEFRLLHTYDISKKVSGILASGIRFYHGRTSRGQGLGSDGRDADFTFLHPDNLEYSDYVFTNNNVAVFAENVFRIGKLSIVPGIRYEFIEFLADGYFNSPLMTRTEERGMSSRRNFPLLGLGLEYKINNRINIYANYTEGFRSANFNDIRITSPNIVIDPNLKDSHGYNIDLGVRGTCQNVLTFDINGFCLKYNDRIGLVTRLRADNTSYSYSTNIANSRNLGVEAFSELNLINAFFPEAKQKLSLFVSYSYIDAKYISSDNDVLSGKKVETAPNHILRSGATFKIKQFSTTINYSYISQQFSDANNTMYTVTGSNGIVPAYSVMDWSSKISFNTIKIGVTINNVTNNKYFTRRATSYPGPGIIPAEPRTFLVSAEFRL